KNKGSLLQFIFWGILFSKRSFFRSRRVTEKFCFLIQTSFFFLEKPSICIKLTLLFRFFLFQEPRHNSGGNNTIRKRIKSRQENIIGKDKITFCLFQFHDTVFYRVGNEVFKIIR